MLGAFDEISLRYIESSLIQSGFSVAMLKIFFVLLVCGLSPWALASHHVAEIYSDGAVWFVDHFEIPDGELQERIHSQSYQDQAEALKAVRKIRALNPSQKKMHRLPMVTTEVPEQSLWPVKHTWSEEWEQKYATWISTNIDEEFFIRNNVATDCADVAYTLRWIFSRNNNLPATATLAGSHLLASHETMKKEWRTLPSHPEWQKDQRFLAALNWLLDNVYTKTLYLDAYPVELSKSTVLPGLMHLSSSHAAIVSRVSYLEGETPIETLSSTVPRKVRPLHASIYIEQTNEKPTDGGLLRFRWPMKTTHWLQVEKENMPYYSLEQYESSLCEDESHFAFCLFKKLDMKYSPAEILKEVQAALVGLLKTRNVIVQEGLEFCTLNDCAPGTQNWEDFSTPSRDFRLATALENAEMISYAINLDPEFKLWTEAQKVPVAGSDLSVQEFKERLEYKLISFDPRDPVETRWGITPEAIRVMIKRVYLETQAKRNLLIAKAAPCRQDPLSCQTSKALFSEHSTLELDYKLRNLIAAWWRLCRKETCARDEVFEKNIESVWFQSPAPWDAEALRYGAQPSESHLLHASVIHDGGENRLILNSSQIYDTQKRKVLRTLHGESLKYDRFTNQYYSLHKSGITFYDKELNNTGELKLPKKVTQTFEMGEGQLLLKTDLSEALFIDLQDQDVSRRMTFTNFTSDLTKKTKYFYFQGEENLLVYAESGELHFIRMPMQKEVKELFHIREKQFFMLALNKFERFTNQSLYLVTPSEVKPVLEDRYMDYGMKPLTTDYFDISCMRKGHAFIDSDLNLSAFSYDNRGVHLGPNRNLIFVNGEAFLLKGQLKEAVALTLPKTAFIEGSGFDWINYKHNNTYVTVNLAGHVLEIHPFKSKDSTGAFLVDSFQGLLERFSFAAFQDSLYTIDKIQSLDVTYEPEMNPSEEKFIEVGKGIFLKNNLTLWFPE